MDCITSCLQTHLGLYRYQRADQMRTEMSVLHLP
jgi:hypothetical protein